MLNNSIIPHSSLRPLLAPRCLGFAPCSQSFAFVALPQYAQSVRYPDFCPSANPLKPKIVASNQSPMIKNRQARSLPIFHSERVGSSWIFCVKRVYGFCPKSWQTLAKVLRSLQKIRSNPDPTLSCGVLIPPKVSNLPKT